MHILPPNDCYFIQRFDEAIKTIKLLIIWIMQKDQEIKQSFLSARRSGLHTNENIAFSGVLKPLHSTVYNKAMNSSIITRIVICICTAETGKLF